MRCVSCPDFWMLSFCTNLLVMTGLTLLSVKAVFSKVKKQKMFSYVIMFIPLFKYQVLKCLKMYIS